MLQNQVVFIMKIPLTLQLYFVEADTLPGLPGQAWAYILLSLSFHGESKTTLHLVMAV